VSQSALSHTIRGMEERLRLRLLTPHHAQRLSSQAGWKFLIYAPPVSQ
jgi:DNA-binding transcriptional LysR family regulator